MYTWKQLKERSITTCSKNTGSGFTQFHSDVLNCKFGAMALYMNVSELESLKREVWAAARDGHASKIVSLLWNIGHCVEEVLNHKTHDAGSETTPLICAARNGNETVVAVLLNFGVDLEQKGTVVHEHVKFHGVTALWCASNWCYFNIVKLLVDYAANVNNFSDNGSSPLKRACYFGGFKIAKCLVENGAGVNSTEPNGTTCLMAASYSGKYEVVQYLLRMGADPLLKTTAGLNALHFSALGGRIDVSQILIKAGIPSSKDNYGRTPLMLAALEGHIRIVEYFISSRICKREDHVNGLELLGTYFLFKKNPDIAKAYDYYNTAMYERYKSSDDIVSKRCNSTSSILAITEKEECTTLDDLEEIQENELALCIEGMHIRERIMGAKCVDLPVPIIHTGYLFADTGDYNKCLHLWIYASNLCKDIGKEFDVSRFPELFARMLHDGLEINFRLVLMCFEIAEREVNVEKPQMHAKKEKLSKHHDKDILACVYLADIMLQICTSKEEEDQLYRAVYNFLQTKPHLENGRTPLHICCDSESNNNNIKLKNEVEFPSMNLCKALTACGANVNAQDENNDTPLHALAKCDNFDSNFLSEMISCLVENGAHLDACNKDGNTAVNSASNCVAASIIKTHINTDLLSLKCLSARVVRKYKIDFEGFIPVSLKDFVELH